MPEVTGLLDRFEEEAQKDGKASAKLIDTIVKQVKSDHAPQFKNNEQLSATWNAIASEVGNLAKRGLQAKKVDDIKRTQDDLLDLEKRIKETPEFQPLLIATQDLLEQINPIIVKRAEYVGSAEQNIKRFGSFIGEKSLGFVEGIARSTLGGIPGGSMLLDKTFGALKRGSAARKIRQERGLSIAAAFSSAAVSEEPAGGGVERVDTGGGEGGGGMQEVGGETRGQQMERVREEEREDDKHWKALMIILNQIFKAVGGKEAARGKKGLGGIPEPDDGWLNAIFGGAVGTAGVGGAMTLAPRARAAIASARTAVATRIFGQGAQYAKDAAGKWRIAKGSVGAGRFVSPAIAEAAQAASTRIGSRAILGALGRLAAIPLAVAELGKDIFDVAQDAEKMKTDVAAKVKKADTYAIAGSLIGGALMFWASPIGIAMGASMGNLIGEQIGAAMDQKDVKVALDQSLFKIETEKTAIKALMAELDLKRKQPGISKAMKDLYDLQYEIEEGQLGRIKEEEAKLADFKAAVEKREEARAVLNQLNADIKTLEEAYQEEGVDAAKQVKITTLLKQKKAEREGAEKGFREAEATAIVEGEAADVEGVEGQVQLAGEYGADLTEIRDLSVKEIDKALDVYNKFLETGKKTTRFGGWGNLSKQSREQVQQSVALLEATKILRAKEATETDKMIEEANVETAAQEKEGNIATKVTYTKEQKQGVFTNEMLAKVGNVNYKWNKATYQWERADDKKPFYTLTPAQGVRYSPTAATEEIFLPKEIAERKRFGGHMAAGKPYIVGEGPGLNDPGELVIPATASRALSAPQTGNYFNQMQTEMAGATGGGGASVVFAPTSAPVSAPTVINNMYQMVTQSTFVRKGDGMSRGI